MSINIRPYQKVDYEQVKSILEQRGLYEPRRDTFQELERKVDRDSKSVIVAEIQEKVVGVVYALKDGAIITHLAVDPTYKNKGIGTLLMQAAERELSEKGLLEASIMVTEGLVPFHESQGYLQQPSKYVWMTKRLKHQR